MWASSPMPLRLSRCGPTSSVASGATNPRARFSSLAVSSKSQPRLPQQNDCGGHKSTNKNSATQDVGGSVTAVKSNPKIEPVNPQVQDSASSTEISESKPQQPSSRGQEERSLSGSDVLSALQRAAGQKIKKKRRDRTSSSPSTSKNRGHSGRERGNKEDASVLMKARAICIKSDWKTRLDEVEKRLQELIDTTTYLTH